MPNVVTYCRVSSEEQAEKDISIPAQRKALVRWVDEQPDLTLVSEFVDEGQSAYAPADKRPGFCEMVSYCRKHNVDFILVHKLDRFSRNREESILFKSLRRKHGVAIKSITENFDPETPQGFLYEGMIEVINQFYSMNLATETMKGMRENAERGWHNGGRTPYAYRLEKVLDGARERGRLVPGPDEEVAALREMYELSAYHGWGSKRIANHMNEKGVPAPRGGAWNCASINAILDNPVYVGDVVWYKSRRSGRRGREATAVDDRIVTTDAHEALVSREIWEARQAAKKTRRFDVTKNPARHSEYLLTRLIRCEHCGGNFVGRRHTYKARTGEEVTQQSYYCSGYLYKGKAVCRSLPIDAAWVEAFVLDIVKARLCQEDGWAELEGRLRGRREARRARYGTTPKAAEAKLAEIDRKIANYYRAIGDGMDVALCKQLVADLEEQRGKVAEEARVLREEDYYDAALEKNLAELDRFRRAFAEGFDRLPMGIRRQVVLHFVESIVVHDRRELQVTFQIPFDGMGITQLTDDVQAGAEGRWVPPEDEEPALEAGSTMGFDPFPVERKWLPSRELVTKQAG